MADTAVRNDLERVKAYLADSQWDEAVQTLRGVLENSGDKLLAVTERRYVSLRDYCHLQFASLPPEALALYRSLVDPLSAKWYEEGIAGGDRRLLLEVVRHAFAGSWGDDALAALGEMALETGDYAGAREYWEKIIPVDLPADAPGTWLCFPDTDLDLAAIRARLVLVSILEGSPDGAREELAAFARLHPDARGRLGGREVNYAEALNSLLAASAAWPPPKTSSDWPTFAGSPSRNKTAPRSTDVGQVVWRVPLRGSVPAGKMGSTAEAPLKRVAEDAPRPLSYHPLLLGNLVLVNNQVEILAIDVRTGRPVWGQTQAAVYRDEFDETVRSHYSPSDSIGVPRFTMTAFDGGLYARMGTSITSRPRESTLPGVSGYIVCLDLESQGRLVQKIAPEDKSWAFEGSPLADGANLYVAMRRSGIRPQAHVACFDLQTGRRRWRRFVCAAETPAGGMLHENTHNLLTLHRQTLYYNTNLGAVAALSTDDGQLKWVSLYPRARNGDLDRLEPHFCRDLTPCLYHRGTLLVAPSDSRRIYALEAATGQILWQTGRQMGSIVHLLGVSGQTLVASGHKLVWISLDRRDPGKVKHLWPDGHEKLGYGRGVLAGDCVWWPTREKIYVFDRTTARLKEEIQLIPRGVTGGNLLVADEHLLIATDDELIALGRHGRSRSDAPGKVALDVRPPEQHVGSRLSQTGAYTSELVQAHGLRPVGPPAHNVYLPRQSHRTQPVGLVPTAPATQQLKINTETWKPTHAQRRRRSSCTRVE